MGIHHIFPIGGDYHKVWPILAWIILVLAAETRVCFPSVTIWRNGFRSVANKRQNDAVAEITKRRLVGNVVDYLHIPRRRRRGVISSFHLSRHDNF